MRQGSAAPAACSFPIASLALLHLLQATTGPGAPLAAHLHSSPALAAMGALPSEALEVLQRLSASNEGRQALPDKLALLERRLTVPPSPVASGQAASLLLGGQNSVHSVTQPSGAAGREGTPSISATALGGGGRSLDGLEANSEHPSKRRRVGGAADASKPPAAAGGRGPSPSAAPQQRPSLSPFLGSEGGAPPKPQPTPISSKKQKNTISRYFPTLSGGAGGVAGGGAGGGVAQPPPPARRILAASPAPSDQQATAPAAPEALQMLQAEAQRLR